MYNHSKRPFTIFLFLCLLLIGVVQVTAQGGSTSVFINELHYDNTGSDTGEFIEIAGPAGTDLSGWTLALYNGSATQLNVYNTVNLLGILPDATGSGFGFVSFAIAGIQNGSPDGMALVDDTNAVVQFLCYEGTFTAASGPASGQTCTDIGVSEPSTTPVGDSLQLTGTGTVYEDFTWAGPSANTSGAVNTGQTFGTSTGGDPILVINEIDYDQASTDTAEFVEIKNDGTDAVNLDTYSLVFVNGSGGGSSIYDTIDLPNISLAAGDYYVVCANAATVDNCDLDDGPDTNFIQNGAPDAVALLQGTTIVDTVSYEGDTAAPYTEGTGADADNPNDEDTGLSRFPDGTDTNDNSADFSQRCITPGASNSSATSSCVVVVPDVAINEIRIDHSGSADEDEYFEIAGADGTSLNGLTYLVIGDGTGGSGVIEAVVNLSGSIPTDGFFVVAQSTFTLGTADQTVSLNFENSDNVTHLLVVGFTGADGDDLDTNDDGTLDSTPWSEIVDSVALVETVGSGDQVYSSTQIGPDGSFVPGHVFRCPDQTGDFQIGDFTLGTNDTPGDPNDCGPGSGGDPVEAFIHEIQGSGPNVTGAGPFIVEGVVVGDYQVDDELDGFFIQEETTDEDGNVATSEGIFVFCGGCPVDVAEGNIVKVTGAASDFFGMSQLTATDVASVEIINAGDNSNLVTPATIDLPVPASFTNIDDYYEQFEGMLVDFADEMTVTEYFQLARFGQILLSEGGKLRQFTNDNIPSAAGFTAHLDDVARRSIFLDDLNNAQNIDPVYHPQPGGFSVSNFIRGGYTIPALRGVLHYSFPGSGANTFRIRPQQSNPVAFVPSNPREAAPAVAGNIHIASFNVLNYFNGDGCRRRLPNGAWSE